MTVEGVEEERDGTWRLDTSAGPVRAANVLLALGRRGNPRKLGVPGEELSKVSYTLLEPDPFRGKHVLVVGGGNSAVENALSLADFGGCASVAISYRRGAFARCRAENKRRIDALIATGKVRPLLPSEVVRIDEREVVLTAGRPGDDGAERRRHRAGRRHGAGRAPAEVRHRGRDEARRGVTGFRERSARVGHREDGCRGRTTSTNAAFRT